MEKEGSLGKMDESITVNTKTTRKKASEPSLGQMAESMLVIGDKENNTEKEPIQLQKEMKSMENGKMERESDGSTNLSLRHN
jgi:hypothetical protein